MAIPPQFINQLKDRVVLSEVIGQRINVKRAGREYKACCPFHKEKTPSFTINNDKQFYHCFGCGAHGGAIDFVMQHDNLSFVEAVEALASKVGMEVPKQSPQEVKKARAQKNLYELIEDTTKFFEQQLLDAPQEDARRYLHERQISPEMRSAFRIGFSPMDGQKLVSYLKEKGYTEKQMIEAGVCRASKYGKDPYAFFRDRVMFPVADRRGRVVAFGGRILPEHLRPPHQGDHKPPKYINSSDTPLFNKGHMLYGESHARQAAGDGQSIIVVEGYLDVIACFENGYRGAVAPLGTAVTEEQILSMWNMIPSGQGVKAPILCFDGDNAGQRAASRACDRLIPLIKADHSAKFAFLPDGQDPDSLIRNQGKGAFDAILESSLPLNEFLWLKHTNGRVIRSPEERAGLEKTLHDEVARIQDRSVQFYYKQFFKQKMYEVFGPAKSKNSPYNKRNTQRGQWVKGGHANDPMPTLKVRRPAFSNQFLPQQILLAAIINHPWLFERAEEFLADMKIENERLDLLRQNVLNHLCHEENHDHDLIIQELTELGFGSELETLFSRATYTHAAFVKRETARDTVIEGWDELSRSVQKQQILVEMQKVDQDFMHDFNKDNERKMMEFRKQAGKEND